MDRGTKVYNICVHFDECNWELHFVASNYEMSYDAFNYKCILVRAMMK